MDLDKKVRISADASQLESTFDRIKRDAAELASGMMQDAEKRVSSSRELIKSLNDEIKLMERRNSLDVTERRSGLQERLDRNPHDVNAKRELSNIGIEEKEAKIQNELLKDILEELKTGKVKELDEKERLEKEAAAGEKHEQRAGALDIKEQDRRAEGFLGKARGYGMSVVGSRNSADAAFNVASESGGLLAGAGGAMAGVGVALMLGTVLGKKMWDASMQYYKQAGLAYAVTGREPSNNGRGFSKYGYSAIDYESQIAPLARSRRSEEGVENSAIFQMLFKKGIGLDEGSYADADRLAVLEGRNGGNNVQRSISSMRNAGIVKGNDMSAVPDYLAIMTNLGKEQVASLGKIDMGINTRMVAALGSMDETLRKSPEALATMVNGIRNGLSSGSSPQISALQFGVLKSIRPDADMNELLMMRENPFSSKSREYLPKYLSRIKELSGGNDGRFSMNIAQMFGIKENMADIIRKGFNSGTLTKTLNSMVDEEGGIKYTDLQKRAEKSTPAQEKLNAQWMNGLIGATDAIIGFTKSIQQAIKDNHDVATEITKQGGLGNRIVGAIVDQGPWKSWH